MLVHGCMCNPALPTPYSSRSPYTHHPPPCSSHLSPYTPHPCAAHTQHSSTAHTHTTQPISHTLHPTPHTPYPMPHTPEHTTPDEAAIPLILSCRLPPPPCRLHPRAAGCGPWQDLPPAPVQRRLLQLLHSVCGGPQPDCYRHGCLAHRPGQLHVCGCGGGAEVRRAEEKGVGIHLLEEVRRGRGFRGLEV